EPAFLILDLMLPGKDGLTICREVRQFSNLPIMMLTAKVDEIDRLIGLELGADDYVCKPFSPREVIARIKNILRRVEKTGLGNSGLKLDVDALRVGFKGKHIDLTKVEFSLFKALHDSPGRIYSRDHLMSLIYADNRIVTDRTIDSHIKKLRKRLFELGLDEDPIHSVYGAGYKFE
ncbi:MAG: response regulator, partial [Gammaproteobacteria bacterium]|nr:response regulator [Gammaproteobacteria bacterium]